MITLKSGICSKDSCISHAKLLGKRARFRVLRLSGTANNNHESGLDGMYGPISVWPGFVGMKLSMDLGR